MWNLRSFQVQRRESCMEQRTCARARIVNHTDLIAYLSASAVNEAFYCSKSIPAGISTRGCLRPNTPSANSRRASVMRRGRTPGMV